MNTTQFRNEDAEQILELSRMMHAESALHRNMSLDEEGVIKAFSTPSSVSFFRAAVDSEKVVGFIYGTLGRYFFSKEPVATEQIWFVHPDYRGARAALMLLREWEEWATACGVSWFILKEGTGVEIEKTRGLFEKLGYAVIGYSTMKRCHHV